MTLILFLHLFFGLWTAYHIYKNRMTSRFSSRFIKSCITAYIILLFLLAQTQIAWLILGIYLPIFIYIFAEWFCIYRQSRLFQDHFSEVLDSIIARMKLGSSFRTALKLSIDAVKIPDLQNQMKELYERVIYSQQLSSSASQEIQFIFQTFQKTDQDLQPISRLHYVRQALNVEMKFRKQAQKALLQIHLQSFILSGLYLAVLTAILIYYGTQFLSVILISSFLFLTGTLTVFLLGRKIKWTL